MGFNSAFKGLILSIVLCKGDVPAKFVEYIYIYIYIGPMPPHVLVDFVVLSSGHCRIVTDF